MLLHQQRKMPSYESSAGPRDGSGDGGSHQQHASNDQHSNSNSKNSKTTLAKFSSLPLESQVCAEVLQHLATGTTPPQSNLLPTTPLTDSDDETSTNDQQAYKRKTDAQHHHLLTAALSILLDSTSPGPDPVALEMLGWAYGSSGIGDWDGCHYMPGEIGTTLRVLQDQVAVQYISERQEEAHNSKNRMGEKKEIKNDDLTNNDGKDSKFGTDGPLDQNQDIWWLQDHEIKYGQGYERPATRFCTIGGVAPLASPYTHGGVIWAPPIAGVCVPSSCTSRGLYLLFDEGVGFADKLLQLSSQDGFYDDSSPGDGPPTASRRFRYMSSLSQSFVAGRRSKMGIICEGESGLPELDVEGYRSQGYYATMGLTFALLMCVIIGTLTANLPMCQIKEKVDDELEEEENGKTIRMDNRRTRTKRLKCYSYSPENTRRPSTSTSRLIVIPSGLSTGTKQLDYGTSNSNRDSSTHSIKSAPDELSPSQDTPKDTFLSKLDQDYTGEMEKKHDYGGHVNIETTSDVASSINIESNASSNSNDPYIKTKRRSFLRQIKSLFSVWDAAQSFYEITRMKREDYKTLKSSLHEHNLQHVGSQSLDPYSSQHGLFAISRKYSRSSFRSLILNSPGADKQHRKTISMSSSKCLNGMRSISMLWIIFGHTLAVQSSIGYNNPAAMLPPTGMLASTLGSIILSARYAVDTFLFIGGYLVMSGLLKRLDPTLEEDYEVDIETEQIVDFWTSVMAKLRLVNLNHVVVGDYVNRLRKKRIGGADSSSVSRKKKTTKGLLWMIPFLIHRVLRILPTYGFVLLIWWKVAVTMGDGPFWPRWATLVAQCDANAWTNMLFVNNLVPRNQPFGETSECMYHAWYLGVDFQLCAVLTPIFVTMFLRKGCRKFTIIIESLLVLGIVIASIICSYRYGWSAHLFDGSLTGAFDRGFYINPFFSGLAVYHWIYHCAIMAREVPSLSQLGIIQIA